MRDSIDSVRLDFPEFDFVRLEKLVMEFQQTYLGYGKIPLVDGGRAVYEPGILDTIAETLDKAERLCEPS